MKKLLYLFGAMALMLGMVACGDDNDGGLDLGDDFLDNITLDGFYVYGPATGAENIISDNMMSRGVNEVDKTFRPGMKEKYLWLEGGKDFFLINYEAGKISKYSAILSDVDLSAYDENPKGFVHSGKLMTEDDVPAGMELPAMQVAEDGFYHIIFDTNVEKDIPQAQIIVMPVEWYINGANVLDEEKKGAREVKEDGTIIWTWDEVECAVGAAMKFKYDPSAWKINLDATGDVRAEISLGDKMDGKNTCSNYTDKTIAEYNDIYLTGAEDQNGGVYKVTLTYTKQQGEVGDSFKYNFERLRDLNSFLVGGYALTPMHADSKMDASWAVRYLTAGTELKAESKIYNRETKQWEESIVATATVENTGLNLIFFDNAEQTIALSEAQIYGIGPVFEGNETWSEKTFAYTVNEDGTVTSPAAVGDGVPRQYLLVEGASWWQAEFVVTNGVVVYRGAGGEVHGKADVMRTGQKLTIDFATGEGWFE